MSVLTVVPAVARQQPRLSKQDADRFEGKLTRIVAFGNEKRARAAKPDRRRSSDAEVNAYFEYAAKDQVPAGIVEPTLNALGDGRVGGRAIVDLDAVRKQKQRGWLDPLAYLTGTLPLTASGHADHEGRRRTVPARVGARSPASPSRRSLLQELLSVLLADAGEPAGINMDDPFELPARIREIRVGQGQRRSCSDDRAAMLSAAWTPRVRFST